MKAGKKLLVIVYILLVLLPINVFAYSDKVILGGENIGISVSTKEILVVGFYKVNNEYIASKAGFAIGDKIVKVNDTDVSNIEDLVKEIKRSQSNVVKFSLKRNEEYIDVQLELVKDKDNYKTGLYIKDEITGIGTLTYIDPETNIFGSLGHEIADNKTGKIIDIKDGFIFDSSIIGTIKSSPTSTGEKRAIFNQSIKKGSIEKNTNKGIFGTFEIDFDVNDLIPVAKKEEVSLGPATIYTVLDDNIVKSYIINIIKINNNSSTKNILFEIDDEELMNKTNGVIKGMSGSPIVQNGKIIGAVTHAIVNDNTKGYGIFITTMLEEGEK